MISLHYVKGAAVFSFVYWTLQGLQPKRDVHPLRGLSARLDKGRLAIFFWSL
jgi:hypothetical protein